AEEAEPTDLRPDEDRGEDEPDAQRQDREEEDEDEGVPEGLAEPLVGEDVDVVVEPDEGREREPVPVVERDLRGPGERVEEEERIDDERRREEEVGGEAEATQPPRATLAGRPREGCDSAPGLGGHRHSADATNSL